MPTDHKRINGPENTVPYKLYTKLNVKSFNELFRESVTDDGKRRDNRTTNDQRKVFLKTGVISQAKGSSYIEVGRTKVIVSVFDPREIPNKTEYCLSGELYCEFKYAPFSCSKRRMHQQDPEEKQSSIIMKQALEPAVCRHQFPNFQVDIYALVLENDGSALSAAITCAGLALAHAGVPMYDLITSVTLGVQGNTKLLDPTFKEEDLCSFAVKNKDEDVWNDQGLVTLSVLDTSRQVTGFYQTGHISLKVMNESIDTLTDANKVLVPLIQKCLVKHVIKGVKDNIQQ